jgi:hypothetical protein
MTLSEAITEARANDEQRKANGYDQAALNAAAALGFANGAFEESDEDGGDVVEEFFPDASVDSGPDGADDVALVPTLKPAKPTLRQKLDKKAASDKLGELP